jgi:dihydrofolate reductase
MRCRLQQEWRSNQRYSIIGKGDCDAVAFFFGIGRRQYLGIMRETILYIASSLDGYIAKADGDVQWLEDFPNPDQSDYGYAAFLSGCDTLVMGAGTYRQILSFGIEWPYADKDVYVMSRNADLEIRSPRTSMLSGPEAWLQVKESLPEDGKNCWLLGGGQIIREFLRAGAIDRILLTQFPLLLGAGIPLFPGPFDEQSWKTVRVTAYASGAIGLELVPANAPG